MINCSTLNQRCNDDDDDDDDDTHFEHAGDRLEHTGRQSKIEESVRMSLLHSSHLLNI